MKRFIAFLISFSILGYLLYSANLPLVISELSKADLTIYLLVFLLTILVLCIKTYRWNLMLKRIGINLGFFSLFQVLASGIFLSSLTPGRSGEPIRAYLLKMKEKTSFTKVMPTIVVERILDILAILIFATMGSFFFPIPSTYSNVLRISVSVVLIATITVLILCVNRRLMGKFLDLFFKFFMKSKKNEKNKILDNFYSGISILKTPKIFTTLFILSVLSWFIESISILLIAQSVGITLGLGQIAFILSISILIGLASFLPGGLGSAELSMAYLISLIVVDLSIGTAITLLYRFSTLYFTCLLGAIFIGLGSKYKESLSKK